MACSDVVRQQGEQKTSSLSTCKVASNLILHLQIPVPYQCPFAHILHHRSSSRVITEPAISALLPYTCEQNLPFPPFHIGYYLSSSSWRLDISARQCLSQTGTGLLLCFQVHHLGFFDNEEEAARVYDAAVLKLRGPSCHTNFDPRQAEGREPLKESLVESMTNSSLPRSVTFLPAAQTGNEIEPCPKGLDLADLCDVSSTVKRV